MTSVTDFSQFTDMRALASRDESAALRDVAEQFESLFVHSMLKSMREASFGDPIFGDAGGAGMFRDMFDQQIAADIASGPGLGLADLLVRQMGGTDPSPRPEAPLTLDAQAPGNPLVPAQNLSPEMAAANPALAARIAMTGMPGLARDAGIADIAAASSLREPVSTDVVNAAPASWSDAKRFVADILPFAREAAERLEVTPLAVLSQAALETGWGKHVMPDDGGANSLNLFGIKARGDWQGALTHRSTVEFEQGVMTRQREPFRVYESLKDTFSDYVNFLKDNDRYADVARQRDDVGGFADALQGAGYATDPDYAEKIRRVAGGETMRSVLDALKQSDLLSLSMNVR